MATPKPLPSGLKYGANYMIESMLDIYIDSDDDPDTVVLNINDGKDNDGTVINLKEPVTGANYIRQQFCIMPSGSYFKLGAICSSNKRVLDAYRPLSDGCTVDIWENKAVEDDAQQLVIEGSSINGYTIRLASQYNLALTAVYVNSNWVAQFKTYSGSQSQKWIFSDRSVTPSLSKQPDYNKQNKDQWCWAASAKYVGKQNNGQMINPRISTLTQRLDHTDGLRDACYYDNNRKEYFANGAQRAIVMLVKGSDANNYGTTDNMEIALETVNPNANYKLVGTPGGALSSSNKALFKTEVQKGRYILAGFTKKGSSLGHVVAITDYNSSTNTYTLYDPWNGSSPTITGDKIFTYTNGLAGSNNSTYGLEYFFYIA